jgi:hypothetical protein
MAQKLIADTEKILLQLLKARGIRTKQIVFFGSVPQGRQNADSDIDLSAWPKPGACTGNWSNISAGHSIFFIIRRPNGSYPAHRLSCMPKPRGK